MPCVSLIHRKIYKNTVAKRIVMYRLCRATEKATSKAAAAQSSRTPVSVAAPQVSANQSSPVLSAVPALVPAAVSSTPPSVTSSSASAPIPESHSSVPMPSASASLQIPSPVTQISSNLQDFQDGVEVKIAHPKISKAQPLTTSGLTVPTPLSLPSSPSTVSVESISESRPPRRRLSRAEIINAESSLGRTLFGPIPSGHRREFFHDHENIWIWHEDWYEKNRNRHQMTVRYEVRPTGVYKKISAGNYIELMGDELENFRRATHAYLHLIKRNLYHLA